MIGIARIRTLISQQRMENEIDRINNGLAPTFTFSEEVSGSVESEWGAESVGDNFDRLLDKQGSTDRYTVTLADRKIPVDIEIFSYRDGAKVEYEFNYEYEAKGDGSVTYSKDEINAVVDRIRQVAND